MKSRKISRESLSAYLPLNNDRAWPAPPGTQVWYRARMVSRARKNLQPRGMLGHRVAACKVGVLTWTLQVATCPEVVRNWPVRVCEISHKPLAQFLLSRDTAYAYASACPRGSGHLPRVQWHFAQLASDQVPLRRAKSLRRNKGRAWHGTCTSLATSPAGDTSRERRTSRAMSSTRQEPVTRVLDAATALRLGPATEKRLATRRAHVQGFPAGSPSAKRRARMVDRATSSERQARCRVMRQGRYGRQTGDRLR